MPQSFIDAAAPIEITAECRRRCLSTTYRSPHERCRKVGERRRRPILPKGDMLCEIQADVTLEIFHQPASAALPEAIVQVGPERPSLQREQSLWYIEIDHPEVRQRRAQQFGRNRRFVLSSCNGPDPVPPRYFAYEVPADARFPTPGWIAGIRRHAYVNVSQVHRLLVVRHRSGRIETRQYHLGCSSLAFARSSTTRISLAISHGSRVASKV